MLASNLRDLNPLARKPEVEIWPETAGMNFSTPTSYSSPYTLWGSIWTTYALLDT